MRSNTKLQRGHTRTNNNMVPRVTAINYFKTPIKHVRLRMRLFYDYAKIPYRYVTYKTN